ncbi:MAG: hypothetical protein AAB538_00565, partial [Patescibacteria group bacterium]
RLSDWRGKNVQKATPSMPVTIVGLKDVPNAGDILQVVEARAEATAKAARPGRGVVKSLAKADEDDERSGLALVIKADSHGSLEALTQTIRAMVPENLIRLTIVRADVGNVSDSDVLTAKAAGAVIYAFNTNVGGMSQRLATQEHVPIKRFDVIYRLSEDIRKEVEERLPFDLVREDLGRLKVLKVFFSTPKKKIVGGEVAEGKVEIGAKIVTWRNVEGSKERERIGSGEIKEMQREKTAVKSAARGDQVGITVEGKGKIKEGDVLEIYKEEKVRKQMTS